METRCIKLLAVLSLLACISFAVTLRTVSGGEKEGGEGTKEGIHFDPDEDVDSRLLRELWELRDKRDILCRFSDFSLHLVHPFI